MIKEGYNTRYFGGKTESVEKYTRVKARVKAHALKEIMTSKSEIFIMGHKIPDVDALGAAVGIYRCAKTIEKPAHIVMDNPPDAIRPMIDMFRNSPEYGDTMFVTQKEAIEATNSSTVVVVVDTNKRRAGSSPTGKRYHPERRAELYRALCIERLRDGRGGRPVF